MKDLSFFERIRELGRITPSEARIAEHMEKVYPMIALETITTICECADVGRATVVRFIQKLGYDSFAHFQRNLRSEILQRLQPIPGGSDKLSSENLIGQRPAGRAESLHSGPYDLFRQYCDESIRNISEAVNRNDYSILKMAARKLAKCKGDIYIMGHRTSFALAAFFHYQLDYLRDGVQLCRNFWGELPNSISRISKDDLLFIFFNSRYSRMTEKVAHWFAEHGCEIILLTDRETNPLSRIVTLQLVGPSHSLGFFDSRVAAFVIFETLSSLVAIEIKDKIEKRFEKFEGAINAFDVYSEWWKHKPRKRTKRNAESAKKGENKEVSRR